MTRMRPGRSVTKIRPLGLKASAQGTRNPVATVIGLDQLVGADLMLG